MALEPYMNLTSAAAAAFLVILMNLENFSKSQDKAQQSRKEHELFSNSQGEFESLWITKVEPFGNEAEGCVNALKVYRMICDRDRKLREFQIKTEYDTKLHGSRTQPLDFDGT